MAELSKDELKRQIINFLSDFKELMRQGSYSVENHLKNRQCLIDLGITQRLREDIIRSLDLVDYSSGPVPGEYRDSDLFWIFGKVIDGIEIYIKLEIVPRPKGDEWAVCKSFHSAERPLKYPFRNKCS